MMRAGAGRSTRAVPAEAADEALNRALAAAGTTGPDLVFLFASGVDEQGASEMAERAVALSGTEAVVGCTGMGVLSAEGEVERAAGAAALAVSGDALEAVPLIVDAQTAGEEIPERLMPYAQDAGLLVLLPDVFTVHPADLIAKLSDALPGVPIVGGAAAGSMQDPAAFQWCGTSVTRHGVAGVLLRGDIEVLTGVAQGCRPFGQAYAVTKAEGNVIQEIAFAPAVDALKEALDTLSHAEKENVGPAIFVGLAMDEYATQRGQGDYLIRNLVGLSRTDGSIAIGERVHVGQTIQFNVRTAEAAHEDLEQRMARLARELRGRTGFGVYFNCLGRGFGLFGQPDHDVSVIGKHLGGLPFAGFFGNAEFAPVGGRNHVHSYTGGMAVITEVDS
jgi:small ligand-binding sensory domain FIST